MKFTNLKIVICIHITLELRRQGLPKKDQKASIPIRVPLRYIRENINKKVSSMNLQDPSGKSRRPKKRSLT